jgi:hypothetical protein
LVRLVPKEMPEPRETLAYPVRLGRRVTLAPLAPLALPVLKVIVVTRVILDSPELPGLPVPLVVPGQLDPLALLVWWARPQRLVGAC